jgi:hypothetical protein
VTLEIPAGNYQQTWLDVKSGRGVQSASIQHAGGTLVLHSPAFKDGMALSLAKEP